MGDEVAERGGDALKEAQEDVAQLYQYNLHYFEQHGLECAAEKDGRVKKKMEETVSLLEQLKDSLPKVQYWALRGKALNILPEHSPEAEQSLSRAIKHDPSLVDAWNALGESYWKAGKVQQAHDCFTGSLEHSKNKESLRNLSVVLRQMGKDAAEKLSNVEESVVRAKEAVGLDVQDGVSWMVLGNAYISLFFMSNQDPKILKQCVSAYTQAERDPVAANNPDLHFNIATVSHYEEDYGKVLQELSLASSLDPAWDTPRDKMAATWQYLQSMQQLISYKGKLKAKKLSAITASLSAPETFLGCYGNSKVETVSGLVVGCNKDKVLLGAVTVAVATPDRIPYACVMTDSSGTAFGLSVYNLAVSTHFAVGDVLTLPDPTWTHYKLEHKEESVEFYSVRVNDPSLLLLNGQKIPPEKLAASCLSIKAFS